MGDLKGSWLYFEETPPPPSKVTKTVNVYNRGGDTCLGVIKWISGWRRYGFYPAPDMLFDAACLTEITARVTKEQDSYKASK